MRRFIKTFRVLPKEMFRLNYGASIALRDRSLKRSGAYDLWTEAGKVKPKALDPSTYEFPNGASMRPNTASQNRLVQNFRGDDGTVYCLPKATRLPDDLILVHEFKDHYSLQAAKEMTLEELNLKINTLLNTSGRRLTQEQWLKEYPNPTERS